MSTAISNADLPPPVFHLNDTSFELRGIKLEVFQKLRDMALGRNPDKNFWSMGRLSANIIGNHEILKKDCRWGVVDPKLTLTHLYQCSFIDSLKRNALLIAVDISQKS